MTKPAQGGLNSAPNSLSLLSGLATRGAPVCSLVCLITEVRAGTRP